MGSEATKLPRASGTDVFPALVEGSLLAWQHGSTAARPVSVPWVTVGPSWFLGTVHKFIQATTLGAMLTKRATGLLISYVVWSTHKQPHAPSVGLSDSRYGVNWEEAMVVLCFHFIPILSPMYEDLLCLHQQHLTVSRVLESHNRKAGCAEANGLA